MEERKKTKGKNETLYHKNNNQIKKKCNEAKETWLMLNVIIWNSYRNLKKIKDMHREVITD